MSNDLELWSPEPGDHDYRPEPVMIKLLYESVDGFTKEAHFTEASDAMEYIQKWLGRYPDNAGFYAISDDGVSKVSVMEGPSLRELLQ